MMNKKNHPIWLKILPILMITSLFLGACRGGDTPGDGDQEGAQPEAGATSTVLPSHTPESVAPTATSAPTETPLPTAVPPTPTETPLPGPPQESVGGLELHKIMDNHGLGLMQDSNIHWIRRNSLDWSIAEPVEGQIDWAGLAELEQELQNASAQGYEVILIIRNAPDWAQMRTGVPCGPVLPEKLPAFANFMNQVVSKYSAPPFNVKYWEIGNEPDVFFAAHYPQLPFGCWGDQEDPYFGGPYYADMLKTVTPQIKSADPEAQVLVGGLLLFCNPINPPQNADGTYADCTPSKFLEGILQNGGGEYFDGVSFHAYDYYLNEFPKYGNGAWHSFWDSTGPTFIAKTDYLRSLLNIYGYPEKFLILSEVGILCSEDPECQDENFEQTKSAFISQTAVIAQTEGLRATIWYSIRGWRGTGLATGKMEPKPAFDAYKFTLSMLQDAAPRGEITDYDGIRGYKFDRNGQELWVLWTVLEPTSLVTELPATPEQIYDMYGNPMAVTQTVEVPGSPLFIIFATP